MHFTDSGSIKLSCQGTRRFKILCWLCMCSFLQCASCFEGCKDAKQNSQSLSTLDARQHYCACDFLNQTGLMCRGDEVWLKDSLCVSYNATTKTIYMMAGLSIYACKYRACGYYTNKSVEGYLLLPNTSDSDLNDYIDLFNSQ